MLTIISYDIVQDRRRLRLAKLLNGHGERVQKSVFECDLSEPQFRRLREKVEALIDPKDDSVRYYFLCAGCRRNIEVSGWGARPEADNIVVV